MEIGEHELTEPSKAHEEAIHSVIYRLSELMFGSLLASYVLGFIGFSAPKAAAVFAGGSLKILFPEVLTYLLISMTFAYLTAGLYISYHVGILTMPHLPFSNLRWDFMVALLQAVLFGFSMLLPLWLPIWISFVLFAALARQRREHKDFVRKLMETFGPKRLRKQFGSSGRATLRNNEQKKREREYSKYFSELFDDELGKTETLKSWWKVSSETSGWAVFLLAAGGGIVTSARFFPDFFFDYAKYIVPSLVGGVFVGIMLVVNRVLSHRADFMYSDEAKNDVDKEFREWISQLVKGITDAAEAT